MSNIREVLEEFVGQKLIMVSQNDSDERPYAMLMFDGGGGIKITLDDAVVQEFDYGEDED